MAHSHLALLRIHLVRVSGYEGLKTGCDFSARIYRILNVVNVLIPLVLTGDSKCHGYKASAPGGAGRHAGILERPLYCLCDWGDLYYLARAFSSAVEGPRARPALGPVFQVLVQY